MQLMQAWREISVSMIVMKTGKANYFEMQCISEENNISDIEESYSLEV
jgi:hypothetical protein